MAAPGDLLNAPPVRTGSSRRGGHRSVLFAVAWVATFAGIRAAEPDASGAYEAVPFAPPSRPDGATMFTLLDPAQTGVVTQNNYADPAMWAEHYQELAYGAMGCGVAIGDYDNDGRPDVFVVSKTESCRLFRNLGGWRFADVTAAAGLGGEPGGWAAKLKGWIGLAPDLGDEPGAWKQGATFADVNNDGWLDLYVCRFNAPNWLFMNQGDGTFIEEAAARGLAIVDGSGVGAFADYDRDGWLDVYVQTNMYQVPAFPHGRRDYLLRNRGDGTFEDVTDRAGISGETSGHSATWWDYDEDGWPDLYVANDFAVSDSLYRNNGDGTFTDVIQGVVPHQPYYAMGADLGDVDNDGRLDLFVADMAPSTHEQDQRGMAGSRARAQVYASDAAAPQFMRNALYLNTGAGRMREGAWLAGVAATDWTWSVRFEDFDHDGRVDLHVTNGMIREYHNADLLARLMGAENQAQSRRIVRASPVMAERNFAFRNRGDYAFEDVGAAWGLNQTGVSFGAATGDLDGDGDLDLVYTNYEAGVTMLRNDSTEGHRVIVALRGTRSNRFGLGATVRIRAASGTQVRSIVAARGYLSSSEPIAHFGVGDATRIDELVITWPGGHRQTLRDLPVDRRFTITEPDGEPAALTAAPAPPPDRDARPEVRMPGALFTDVSTGLLPSATARARAGGTSPGPRQPLLPFDPYARGPALAVADLDGDRRHDVVMGGDPATGPVAWRVDGARLAPWRATQPSRVGEASGPVLVFEADGDGRADVLMTSAAPGPGPAVELWLGREEGGWRPAPEGYFPRLDAIAGALVAADFDRDGRLDVFLGSRLVPGEYPLPAPSLVLRNTGDGFVDVTATVAPGLRDGGLVTAALATDVDVDGWVDLLVACDWGGVRFWRNDAGRRFEDQSGPAGFAAAGTGWWTSLAAADFNGDGRLDYVAGNVGLNTMYSANDDSPALLFHGDFGGSSSAQLVEAHYEEGRLVPRRTRTDLGAQIPPVLRRFRHTDDYARASLDEILGADRLARARRFAVTELRSGVFLSDAHGTYRFIPLPRIAQIAPLQGMVAGDWDGDSHADIVAAQNSFAPIESVGRFDGGLGQLLRGDGAGRFSAVPPLESGIMIPGDGEALVASDLNDDGWPDILITRHRAAPLAFRNQGVPGRRMLRVGLRGPSGNPDALGARVTLTWAEGAAQTAEIAAESSRLSQSTPACFFGLPAEDVDARIRVRWPDGTSSEHTVPARAMTMVIEKP